MDNWFWILAAIAVVGLIAWYLMGRKKEVPKGPATPPSETPPPPPPPETPEI